MARDFPRLRPDPVPQFTAVPESLATGQLKSTYEETKAALCVPWMGVVTMAFAYYPTFYRTLWNALAPVVTTAEFAEASKSLRQTAEAAAVALDPPNITERLKALGYSQEEIQEIAACNEVFSSGNMPYLLIATRARLSLEGDGWPAIMGSPSDSVPPMHPRPVLVEKHHASNDLRDLYADIQKALRLPFVNTDYRAFARWPSYFAAAWADLGPSIGQQSYENQVSDIHNAAIALARDLPNPKGLTSAELQDAAQSENGDVIETVRLFQWLLPGLALNVAFFRHQILR